MANRKRSIGAVLVLIVGFASIGLYLPARTRYTNGQIRQIVQNAYRQQRPVGGRLSGAAYKSVTDAPAELSDLGRAQVMLLAQQDSPSRRQMQAQLYLAAGDWQRFIDFARNVDRFGDDAGSLNNLGASYLALAERDPAFLLKALDAFERAAKLNPKAAEPLYNLVITYRKLRFSDLAAETLRQYREIEPGSPWLRELENVAQTDEAAVFDEFKLAVEANNLVEAERLFLRNPELYRRVAMQYAFWNDEESVHVLRTIAAQIERHYGDKTVSGMLAPLFTDRRASILSVRELVNQGAELYQRGNFRESLRLYEKASRLAAATDSVLDRLWIDLNKVEPQIRLAQFGAARESLSRIVSVSNRQGYLWLKAKALAIYGSTKHLTSSFNDIIDLLTEADRIFIDVGAQHDRIRVLYYLSSYRYYAGDEEEGLRLALECLRMIADTDSFRMSALNWLIGSILYRQRDYDRSILFTKRAVEEGQKSPYAGGVEVTASIALAQLYESTAQYQLADQYLGIAEQALPKIEAEYDRAIDQIRLGLVKAKSNIHQSRYAEAEDLLQDNLDIYSRQPFSATPLLSQSLMLLAELYSQTGRIKEAGLKFTEAINVVEKDDEYLKSEVLRVKFDDERRELYDSAIDFEFRNGSVDAAWTYLQKYRAKLFLEFMAAFNPALEPARSKVERTEVQALIPKDTQVVEYALLKDRILIWVVTDKLFTVRSVPASRSEIESKIQTLLTRLRSESDVDLLLVELGKQLIEPVANVLDPNRTITIIPDRALHGLPFGVLKRPNKRQYLIEDFPIVVSPSLTHFLTKTGEPPPRNAIVGFGSQNGSFSEFKELSALASIYLNPATFLGAKVDKPNFLAGLKKAGVFHYAGHSVTDAVDPLRSSILLDGNRAGPNSVTAVDISQQRLANNPVVILSSCDSSVGNSTDGVGMRGLTTAFLIAGAGSVVGSLWPVEGTSTADLMIRFHQAFANSRMPVAEALREAALAYIKEFPQRSHPYYWSSFVVTGNFSALR